MPQLIKIIGDCCDGKLVKYHRSLFIEKLDKCILFFEKYDIFLLNLLYYPSIQGIIVKDLAFSSHVANVLRVFHNTERKISVFSLLGDANINEFFDKHISIDSSDLRLIDDYKSITLSDALFTPQQTVELVGYNLTKKTVFHILWPNSLFNRFLYSLCKNPFEKDIYETFGEKVEIKHKSNNALLFYGDFSQTKISEYLLSENSDIYFDNMLSSYNNVFNSLKEKRSFDEICSLAQEYYQHFLAIHKNYELSFANLYMALKKECDIETANKIMNYVLLSKMDNWLMNNHAGLTIKKGFSFDAVFTSIPDFSIYDDVKEKKIGLLGILEDLSLNEKLKKQILKNSLIFILKEWKFFIIKLIISRICEICNLNSIDPKQIMNEDYRDVKERIKTR